MNLAIRVPILVMLLGMSRIVIAADPVVADLNKRLAHTDVAAVNVYLVEHWETKMARLGRLVQSCDDGALTLSTNLSKTTNLEALQGHVYSLELAMAKCPEKLLPRIPPEHVKTVCAVDAYAETHPSSTLVDELDRRIAKIKNSIQLADSANAQVCVDAYRAAKERLR